MSGSLAPCPKSPNCVSTQTKQASKQREPLTYVGTLPEARRRLMSLIDNFPRTRLVAERDDYLHYEFTTFIGGFIDDVTFWLDDTTKLVHYRSASRKGWWDFGANSRRMRLIEQAWETDL